jgi:predicted nuclease of restriction endonuclease-like (RecB) superfamily
MGKEIKPTRGQGLPNILSEIRSMIEQSRHHVTVTANLAMVNLYWDIGRMVTQDIQKNEKRAGYGEQLIEELGRVLSRDYGQGFSARNLWDMKRFYAEFLILQTVSAESKEKGIDQTPSDELGREIRQTLSSKSTDGRILQTVSAESSERILIDFKKHFRLGWSHYRLLLGQSDPLKRRFYFSQAGAQRWSVRELQRQIDGVLFERVALSRSPRKLAAIEEKKGPVEVVRYEDIFKDPYILDFLGLKGAYSEKDLEAAIIHNLEQFLTELGSDFCFIGRQYSMRIDDVDYFLDLLFFHRGLRCLVAIELKLGTFTAADKGQMDLYLSWLKKYECRQGENEPVGLILCSSKKRQHVELLLSHGPHKMQVSEYLTKLPPKEILEDRLKLYSRLIESDEAEK